MIVSVTLCATHRHRVRHDRTLSFSPAVNAVVGPNGCGKTTILRAIRYCPHCVVAKDQEGAVVLLHSGDVNPQSPRFRRHSYTDVVLQTRGLFSSHGEIMRDVLASAAFGPGGTLLLDEPDSGQDVAWVERMRGALRAMADGQGVQVIMATHHPLLWGGARLIELIPGYAAEVKRRFLEGLSSAPG